MFGILLAFVRVLILHGPKKARFNGALAHTGPAYSSCTVCRKAIEVQDPICKNGGYLRAENITAEPTSCGDCVCPPNWDGGDCGCEYSLLTDMQCNRIC